MIEAETLIILQFPQVQSLILAGDEKQLPSTAVSKAGKNHNYDRSLFARMKLKGYPSHLLDIQYRMHPEVRYPV